jgi:hypothetical protein
MKGGCMESSLMTMLVVLVSIGLGFVGGYYYEKQQSHKQIKENFAMSEGTKLAIGVGAAVGVIILLVIMFKISADTGNLGTTRRHY